MKIRGWADADAGSQLLIGPWTHGGLTECSVGHQQSSGKSTFDQIEHVIRFLNQILPRQKLQRGNSASSVRMQRQVNGLKLYTPTRDSLWALPADSPLWVRTARWPACWCKVTTGLRQTERQCNPQYFSCTRSLKHSNWHACACKSPNFSVHQRARYSSCWEQYWKIFPLLYMLLSFCSSDKVT